jgi:hypothetical protein
MSSPIQYNTDFKEIKQKFKKQKKNAILVNEKNDLYDDLQKNKFKNLNKIEKLMKTDDSSLSFFQTPLHLVIINTISTIENVYKQFTIKGLRIVLNHSDKIYIGVACGFLSVLLLLFKL